MVRCCLLFLVASFLLGRTNAYAQFACGFDLLLQQKINSDPAYRQLVAAAEARLGSKLNAGISRVETFRDTIPVVVHIINTGDSIGSLYNPSDAQIKATIDYVNQVYAGVWPGVKGAGDIGIRFVLAQRDPTCNATNGIDRADGTVLPFYEEGGVNAAGSAGVSKQALMQLIRWDPNRYYNIWVVNKISSPGNGIAAFAMYPLRADDDGVFIRAEYIRPGSTVLPHELGHAFYLYHTFDGSAGGGCAPNADCNTDGDHVCDTDPITEAGGDGRTGINPCTNTPYTSSTEENFMSYTCCNTLFTEGQKMRMQDAAFNTSIRDTLRKSMGRFPPAAGVACSFQLQLTGSFEADHSFLSWAPQISGAGGYTLERSYDGAIFSALAFIEAQPQRNNYFFHDQDAPQQKNYYRLRQNNAAGTAIYSNTVELDRPLANDLQFILITNPVSNYIDVQIGLLPNSPGTILPVLHCQASMRLMDMRGRLLASKQQPVGVYQRLRMPVSYLPGGIYLLQVVVNNVMYTKKVLKM